MLLGWWNKRRWNRGSTLLGLEAYADAPGYSFPYRLELEFRLFLGFLRLFLLAGGLAVSFGFLLGAGLRRP